MNYLTEKELKKFGKTYSLSKRAIALVNQQRGNWDLAGTNYHSLRQLQTRSFHFGHFRIDCQHNPGRIKSTGAQTESILHDSGNCFLCEPNRPSEQAGIPFGNDFTILCNPYPIFPGHLTITANDHTKQQITGNLKSYLRLVQSLDEFVVFYNGPKCGASVPHHLHFQAGIRDILPLEEEMSALLEGYSEVVLSDKSMDIRSCDKILRHFVHFSSTDEILMASHLERAIVLAGKQDPDDEPLLNLLGWFNRGRWEITLFLRNKLRPDEYFAEDHQRLMVSPASVEMAGLVVLPREDDFKHITAAQLESVFRQVSIQDGEFIKYKNLLENGNY